MTDLERLLDAADMNQTQLSKALGIHRNTVTAWRGNPPKYARAYLELRAQRPGDLRLMTDDELAAKADAIAIIATIRRLVSE